VNIELIHTLSRVAPNAEPRFRDDCKYNNVWGLNRE
jgi:hypothetical protein